MNRVLLVFDEEGVDLRIFDILVTDEEYKILESVDDCYWGDKGFTEEQEISLHKVWEATLNDVPEFVEVTYPEWLGKWVDCRIVTPYKPKRKFYTVFTCGVLDQ